MMLKNLILEAVSNGELGSFDDAGAVITLREFEQRFPEFESQYISNFLPESTLDRGQNNTTRNRFLYKVREDAYRVHPDAIEEYLEEDVLDKGHHHHPGIN